MGEWFVIQYDRIKHKTDKAVLMVIEGDEYWLPLSYINYDDFEVEMPAWLAEEKGLA